MSRQTQMVRGPQDAVADVLRLIWPMLAAGGEAWHDGEAYRPGESLRGSAGRRVTDASVDSFVQPAAFKMPAHSLVFAPAYRDARWTSASPARLRPWSVGAKSFNLLWLRAGRLFSGVMVAMLFCAVL